MGLVAGRTELAARPHDQVEAPGMEAQQALRVGEELPLQRKTACQVAQTSPLRRRVLLRPKRRASSLARREQRRLVRIIPFLMPSNVQQREYITR